MTTVSSAAPARIACFASRSHGEGRLIRALTRAPIPLAAGLMVLVNMASMTIGVIRQSVEPLKRLVPT